MNQLNNENDGPKWDALCQTVAESPSDYRRN